MTILLLGLLLGIRHALDADHIVAITAIVSRERSLSGATRVGAWWGAGHTVTVLIAGSAIILLRLAIAPRVALAFEMLVALMLITLGVLALARRGTDKPMLSYAPVVIGSIHGLAGSAAIALLVVAAIPGPRLGVLYLMVFGFGTIVGMTTITFAIALPALSAARRMREHRVVRMRRIVRVGAGVLSLAFGLILAHRIGVQGTLFAATPAWSHE